MPEFQQVSNKLPTKPIKAYKVWLNDGEGMTVVFAHSRNEAKVLAMSADCCEDGRYIDICVKRMKDLDGLYKGKVEIDWYDPETRLILVRDHAWSCLESSWECDSCIAKKHCMYWEDAKDENT